MDLETFLRKKQDLEIAKAEVRRSLNNLNRTLGTPLSMPRRPGSSEQESRRRKRAASGWRAVGMLPPDGAAAMIYLKKKWGFRSYAHACAVALLYLSKATRNGLERIDLDPD